MKIINKTCFLRKKDDRMWKGKKDFLYGHATFWLINLTSPNIRNQHRPIHYFLFNIYIQYIYSIYSFLIDYRLK